MSSFIFLSYGRGDVYPQGTDNPVEREAHFTVVEWVYNRLKDLGMTPWLDKHDLTADREFTDSINQAIESSRYMLLFIGQHSMNSEWCAREWKHAMRHCVPIIPILLEGDWGDADIRKAYPARILNVNGINPRNTDDEVDNEYLLQSIARSLQVDPAPLTTATNANPLPKTYIERPQYTDSIKRQLAVTDKDYAGKNIVGITSEQETATLQGVGGIGKTTLALAICNDCDVRRNFDQIFWVEIGPEVDVGDVPLLMLIIGSHFNDDPSYYQHLQMARTRLQTHFRDKRTLLVLDDVWAEGIVEAFSLANVDCRLLVTTRNKSLVDDSEAVNKLSEAEGLQLLATLLDYRNPDMDSLTDDHRQIIETLDGYTLAIEVAGKWLKKHESQETPRDYLNRLASDEAKLFDSLQLSEKDKNKNLSLSLSLSYNTLSADDQRHFRQLGVLAPTGTVDKDMLKTLWDVDDVLHPLQTLLDLGLLDEDEDGRYSQHSLIRAYARQTLQNTGEFDAVFARYVELVTAIAGLFRELPMEEWGELDPYLPHIDYVGEELVALWADKSNHSEDLMQRAGTFAWNVVRYVYYRPLAIRDGNSVTLRGMNWLEMGLEVYSKQDDKSRQATTLNNIGSVWDSLGDRRKALDYYQQALPLRREVNDKSGEATTLNNIGSTWLALGEVQKALDYFEQALPIQREMNDKSGEATTLNNIGMAWDSLSDRQKALDYYQQALPILREVGNKSGEATTLNNIGSVWDSLSDRQKALDYYQQALPIFREIGNKSSEATTLNNIGSAWRALGEVQKALDYYQQALPLRREVGDKSGEAITLNNIGGAWRALGKVQKALDYYQQALLIHREVGDKSGEATTLNNIGGAWRALGEVQRALDYYQQALPIQREVGDKSGEATTLNNMGMAWGSLGDRHKALDYYQQALPILREVGNKSVEAVACYNIGLVYANEGDLDTAIEYLERCVQLDIEVEDPDLESDRQILERLKAQRDGRTVVSLSQELLEQTVQITSAFDRLQPDNQDKWREALHSQRQTFEDENDSHGVAFFTTLIAILDGETPSLPDANPYQPYLQQVLDNIGGTKSQDLKLPVETLQETVQLMSNLDNLPQDKQAELRTVLMSGKQESEEKNLTNELAFFDALIAILDGETPTLPDSNPYQPYLQQIYDNINSSISSEPLTYEENPRMFIENTIAVCTHSPEKLTAWRGALVGAQEQAQKQNDNNEAEFFLALIAVVDGETPSLPVGNPYQSDLRQIMEGIENYDPDAPVPTPDTSDDDKDGGLSEEAIKALLAIYERSGEAGLRETLQQQGIDNEVIDALVMMIKSAEAEAMGQTGGQSNADATLPPDTINTLASNTFAVKTSMPDKLGEWRGQIMTVRYEWVDKGADWANEVAFADALIAILDGQPPRIPADNPYYDNIQSVQTQINDYDPASGGDGGLSQDATDALISVYKLAGESGLREALKRQGDIPNEAIDAMVDMIKQVVDGGNDGAPSPTPSPQSNAEATLPDNVVNDLCQNTVAVKTVASDKLHEWRIELQKIRTNFSERGADWANEVAFADALISVINDQPPTIPVSNPYYNNIQSVQSNIQGYRSGDGDNDEGGLSEEAMKALITVYQQAGESGLRMALQQQGIPNEAVNALVDLVKQVVPDSSATGGQDEIQLKPEEFQALRQIYQERGEPGLRQTLTAMGFSDAQILSVLRQFNAQMMGDDSNEMKLTEEAIKGFCSNTVLVKTQMPDKLSDWLKDAQEIRQELLSQGSGFTNEVEFMDALIAILNNGQPSLSPNNPYAGAVQAVIETLNG